MRRRSQRCTFEIDASSKRDSRKRKADTENDLSREGGFVVLSNEELQRDEEVSGEGGRKRGKGKGSHSFVCRVVVKDDPQTERHSLLLVDD